MSDIWILESTICFDYAQQAVKLMFLIKIYARITIRNETLNKEMFFYS